MLHYVDKRVDDLHLTIASIASRDYLPRGEFESAHASLVRQVQQQQRIVWIGVGLLSGLQFLIGLFVVFYRRS